MKHDQCSVCEWRSEPTSSSSSSALEGDDSSCLISVQQISGGDLSTKNEELFSIFSQASRLKEVKDVASALVPPTHNSSDASVEIATASRNGITGGTMAFKECPVCTLLSSVEVEVCAVCDHSFKRKAEKREGTTANISSRKTTKCDSTITPEQYFNLLKSRLGDVKFRVCSALHFISQTEDVSSSKWACGYRNIQMLCSSLVQCDAFSSTRLLAAWNSKRLCSVEGVQQLIIEAWREGYDTAGADDMNWCLNKKWIGATECVTVLRFMGINAIPVDFDAVRLQRPMPEELRDWIVTYFDAAPEGDYCPPLYMQNQGHSITIVGYEIHEDKKTTLLVFDPATTPSAMKKALEASNERSDKSFMRDIQEFKRSQYQLVYVTPPSSVTELNICLHKVIVGQLPGQTCFSALKYGSGF